MGVATSSTCVPHEVRWPQTVHVPPVLHAVGSCALGTASMKGAEKNTPKKFIDQFSATRPLCATPLYSYYTRIVLK